MASINDMKAAISVECETTPFVQVTSMCKERTSKRRKIASKPAVQLAYGVRGSVLIDPPGNVIISNPHDAASVYMSGCYGKGSMSKGTPTGIIYGSEHLILSPSEAMYLLEIYFYYRVYIIQF